MILKTRVTIERLKADAARQDSIRYRPSRREDNSDDISHPVATTNCLPLETTEKCLSLLQGEVNRPTNLECRQTHI